MVKDNQKICEYCAAGQDLEGKVNSIDIGEKIYLVDNGGGGHGYPAFEVIGVFNKITESLKLLCKEKRWGIEKVNLNKIKYKYIKESKTYKNNN
tara:strand:+ start:211 stop:492 length:282 start_codon:yes stop_codon:yes gene_type:complete